jgi:IMP-specific 5'-nucleotidase
MYELKLVLSFVSYANRYTALMSHNVKIGIVTAAGYTEAERYYGRLHGLLEAIKETTILTRQQKENIVIMGKSVLLLELRCFLC